MTNEIINLLPSGSLKEKISEVGHVFTDTELLYIISMYAPTFDKKLEMLARFAKTASAEIADAAVRFINYYKANYDAFFAPTDSVAFKVKIWQNNIPGQFGCNFDFIAASFESALAGIDRYYREYEETETEKAWYKIVKTHLFTGNESEDEEFPDYLGECLLDAGKILLGVLVDSIPYDSPDTDDSIDPYNAYKLKVPDFLRNRDLVLYKFGNNFERYGIILEHKQKELINYLYAIPLDSKYLMTGNFADAWRDHVHPYAHSIIKVLTPDELPEDTRKNYLAYMKYLDEQPDS